MLPYIPQPTLDLGPVTIHAFGVLVAAAVLVGAWVVARRARRVGLDPDVASSLVWWLIVPGFIGAHLVERLIYFPRETLADPMSLLRPGIASFGGFLGAILGAVLFVRRRGLGAQGTAWRYLDTVAYAFPFGWIFGRLGCFLAYDHVGLPTDFVLGQRYADGVVRHNLGLEEALFTIPLALTFLVLGRRPRPPGFFVGLLAVLYAPVRFLLDRLRVEDARYLGLTPGQYGAVALLVVGVVILVMARRRGEVRPPRRVEPLDTDEAARPVR